jgi:hypothetical protein
LDLDEATIIEETKDDHEDVMKDWTQKDQMHTGIEEEHIPNTLENEGTIKHNNEGVIHEESKEEYDPNKDLFDMVRNQFERDSTSKPKPRN